MKPTYTWKLTFNFCLILILFSAGIVVCEQYQGKKYKEEAMKDRLDNYTELIRKYIRTHGEHPLQEMNGLLAILPENLRFTWIDNSGTVLYDSQFNPDSTTEIENHAARPEIQQAKKTGAGADIRLSATTQKEYLYYAKRLDNRYIRVALPYDLAVKQFLHPNNLFLYYLLCLLAFGVLFIYYTAVRFGKTIRQLRDYSNAVTNDLLISAPRFPNDEIGEISKYIAEDHRHLKQELTGNIAHELRTPVTGIRGYLETILNNNLGRKKEHEFVGKAYEQILMLSELIRDMSLLSKINESPGSFQLKPIEIQHIIEKVISDLSEALNTKKISVFSTVPADLTVLGNENLLYSVFRNLIDNAINYAGENTTVQIKKHKHEAKHVHFSFSDNGPGIKDERHLPRLFERFYRVEEGRSRDTGGSGLGLSIVKNVILFHGGSISVKNRIPNGLEFLFSLQVV
jgi:signal transduction histidine kinase